MSSTPEPYVRQFDFEDFSTDNPDEQQPGVQLDAEFNAIKTSMTETQSRLAEIQRDDGAIKNLAVHPDALSAATRALIAAGGTPRGAWVTATAYEVGDLVKAPDLASYICVTEHTSGTFATDLAAGKWLLFASPFSVANVFTQAFSGDGATTTFTLDTEFASIEELFIFVGGAYKRGFGTGPEVSLSAPNQITFSSAPAAATRNISVVSRSADVSAAAAAAVAAQTAAEDAQAAAEAAQTAAETARNNAQTAEANAETAEANAETAQAAAEAARDAALAAVGGVKVSADDTTAGDLETKLLAAGLAALSTQNNGANETRTLTVPIASQAEAEAGALNTVAMTPLRVAQAIAAIGGEDQVARNMAMAALISAASTGGIRGPIVSWVANADNFSTKTNATFDTDHYENSADGAQASHTANTVDTASASSYSFAAQAIGAAASDRYVVVGVAGAGTAVALREVTAMTIGGVAASRLVRAVNATEQHYISEIWAAAVPTGTTATIEVTFNAAMSQCHIGVFRLVGSPGTADATATDTTGDPQSASINVPAKGAVIAIASEGASGTWAWTGVTERFDQDNDGIVLSGACDNYATQQTGLTIEANQSTNSRPTMSVVAFAPTSTTPPNMTLSDDAETITTGADLVDVYVLEKTVDANPTRRVRASIDNGSTWATGTLAETFTYADKTLYRYECDVSAQTGTSLKVEYNTLNDGKERNFYRMDAVPLYA
jgi:hypothetical protein